MKYPKTGPAFERHAGNSPRIAPTALIVPDRVTVCHFLANYLRQPAKRKVCVMHGWPFAPGERASDAKIGSRSGGLFKSMCITAIYQCSH